MKDFTKKLNAESIADLKSIFSKNNSQYRSRTYLQNLQSRSDKLNFYLNKWRYYLNISETPAQVSKCNFVINQIILELERSYEKIN